MQILRAFELVEDILVPVFPQWISAHICIPLMSQYVRQHDLPPSTQRFAAS
jgi:hypothetical protein